MKIETIKRPWEKKAQTRKPKDDFYQSSTWKSTREGFKKSTPWLKLNPIRGTSYSNRYCADCWENGIINDERIEIDHILAIKDGGSRTDYNNLRAKCHGHHNGKTHNERKLRGL